MKRPFILLLLALAGVAGASGTPLVQLLQPATRIPVRPTGNPDADSGVYVDTVSDIYWLPLAGGQRMKLGVTGYLGDDPTGGLAPPTAEVDLLVLRSTSQLTPAEREREAQLAERIALNCFNASAAHAASLRQWVITQNNSKLNLAKTAFGPLQVEFGRFQEHDHWNVYVSLARKGTPGSGPWLKFCTLDPFHGR